MIRARNGKLWIAALFFAALWFVLCWHLSGEWSINEQYKYGWFVPIFAAYLCWLRWEDRPEAGKTENRDQRTEDSGQGFQLFSFSAFQLLAAAAVLLLLPIRLLEIANPGWRLLDWSHTAAVAGITLLYIWYAGGRPWLRHFAFPICFFFIAVPWIAPIEEPIVQGLMRTAAAIASETMNLLGIPAQVEGNVIRTSAGVVGVNEACSGVRSLQTSLMVGLLFGELNRLTITRRILLVGASVALALIANTFRCFLLVWLTATRGAEALDRGHDIAGYLILLIVFAGTLAVAKLLAKRKERTEIRDQRSEVGDQRTEVSGQSSVVGSQSETASSSPISNLPSATFGAFLVWLVLVEVGAEGWYRWHERDLVPQAQWQIKWPESAPAFREVKFDDRTRAQLRFDQGRGVVWRETSANAGGGASLLYFFRWQPGRNSALLANLHRPDVCLPSSGWQQVADHGVRTYPVTENLSLPFRHFEFVRKQTFGTRREFAQVFFCVWEDLVDRAGNKSANAEDLAGAPAAWSRSERVRLVLEGRRNLGQQLMEYVFVGSEQIAEAEAEKRFAELLGQIISPPK